MHYLLSLLIGILFLPTISWAQLTYDLSDTASINLPANGSKQSASIKVLNTSTTSPALDWRVVDYHIPSGWSTDGICDWVNCYPLSDPAWHSPVWSGATPNDNKIYFEILRNVGSVSGCAMVKIEYRQQGLSVSAASTNLIVTSFNTPSACWPLAIHDFANSEQVEVYPNPVHDLLKIKLKHVTHTVKIRSILGQIVDQIELSGTENLELNTSSYIEGFYFIELFDTQGRRLGAKKFLKQ